MKRSRVARILALAERRAYRLWREDPKRKGAHASRTALKLWRTMFHAEGAVPRVVAFNEYRDPEDKRGLKIERAPEDQITRMARNAAKRLRKERRL